MFDGDSEEVGSESSEGRYEDEILRENEEAAAKRKQEAEALLMSQLPNSGASTNMNLLGSGFLLPDANIRISLDGEEAHV